MNLRVYTPAKEQAREKKAGPPPVEVVEKREIPPELEMKIPFPEKYTALLSGPPGVGKYEYCLELMKDYLQNGESVVFITTNKSPEDIKKKMMTLGTDIDQYEGSSFMFVDVYSHSTGEKYEKALRVDNPANLNSISVKLSDAVKKVGMPARIFFDSLSGLQIDSLPEDEIKKFFRILSSRVKNEYGFILYTLGGKTYDEKTVNAFRHIVDAVLEMRFGEGSPVKRFRVHHAKELETDRSWIKFIHTDAGFEIIGKVVNPTLARNP